MSLAGRIKALLPAGAKRGLRRLTAMVLGRPSVPAPADDATLAAALGRDISALAPDSGVALLGRLRDALAGGLDEFGRYQAAEALTIAVYPRYKFSEYGRIFLDDEPFLEYYRRFMDPGNWHSLDRRYTLRELLKLVSHLPGDAAECGAHRGFSSYLICEALQGTDAIVHLFDSFEGLSQPEARDGDYWQRGSLTSAEEVLHETLAGFDNYRAYKGWIPTRFEEVSNRRFRFVHIDVDLYQPTYDSLAFFYPRVERGGIVLLDDHGFRSCPGARAAADAYMSDKPEPIALLPTGQGFFVKR